MNRALIAFLLTFLSFVPALAQDSDAARVKTIIAPQPEFPPEASNMIYGDAIAVRLTVDMAGKVKEAVAFGPLAPCSNLNDKGAATIAEAAIKAAGSTVFEPVMKDGKPVDVSVTITYRLPVVQAPQREDPKTSSRKATYLAKPEYSQSAKDKNIQGEVKILILVDEEGKVLSAGPFSGHPELISGALRPACRARFQKHKTKGISVLTYRFLKNF